MLEYMVGVAATPASYTCAEVKTAAYLTSANNHCYYGEVGNANRSYRVETAVDYSVSPARVIFRNILKGETTLDITKRWDDENNYTGYRPKSISFQIYRDKQNYATLDEGVTVSCTSELYDATLVTEDGVVKVKVQKKSDAAVDTASSWHVVVKGLPMYSGSGVMYSYSLYEEDCEALSEDVYYWISTSQGTSEGDAKALTQHFTYYNTIAGSTEKVAYKVWKDISADTANRPDLYFSLYRYLRKDGEAGRANAQYVEETKDQVWVAAEDNTGTDATLATDRTAPYGTYSWQVKVSDLDRFDFFGNEYVYFFEEKMRNDGVTIQGTYVQQRNECTDTAGSYDVFVNTITDHFTLTGKKTWSGVAGFQTTVEDLPNPVIGLYRTTGTATADQLLAASENKETFAQWLTANGVEQVDSTYLDDTKTTYAFPEGSEKYESDSYRGKVEKVGSSWMLPKFDTEGRRYTYMVLETIQDEVANQLFIRQNKAGTLMNRFREDVNRRTITVKKQWKRLLTGTASAAYHSVTYRLYRYEMDGTGTALATGTGTLIDEHTFHANEFARSADGVLTWTFKDLLVYSPRGVQYGYYIVETAINGYSIEYQDEAAVTEGSLVGTKYIGYDSESRSVKQFTITEDMLAAYRSNARIDVISLPDRWASEVQDTAVGTENIYNKQGSVQASGAKAWNDYGGRLEADLRPDQIEITLRRYTESEPGENNAIPTEQVVLTDWSESDPDARATLQWNKNDENCWVYTIRNLERFAPNGMPYIYTLTESPVTGYKATDPVSKKATGDITLPVITNSFEGSYTVRKNWLDGDNRYNLRPDSITVALQRKTDAEGSDWSNIPWQEGFGTYDAASASWTGLPSVSSDDNGPIVSVNITKKHVVANTKGNSWQYTFTNLPTQDAAGHTYTYRCVELAIGGVALEAGKAGAYSCTESHDAGRSTIYNTLESTYLVVNKLWAEDQDDLYGSRPASLTLVLQMQLRPKSDQDTDTGVWQEVTNEDGSAFTFTISKAGGWTATLKSLPVATIVRAEDGTPEVYVLRFRAVERHLEGETGVLGAKNYTATGEHTHNVELGSENSTLTNTLTTEKSITVTKRWRRQPGSEVSATFELQYRRTSEETWHCYSGTAVNDDGTGHTAEAGCLVKTLSCTETKQESFIWEKLPKYDREGNELEYRVVEFPVAGYDTTCVDNAASITGYATEYTFTNTQLQDYTVKKVWQNESYAEKADAGFTATFELQQRIGEGDWTEVEGSEQTLTSTEANDNTKSYTWTDLPKYDVATGSTITYRAIETKINGKTVTDDTNGAYIVTYGSAAQSAADYAPAFANTETVATNRMVYGFADLCKVGAYTAPAVTENSAALKDVSFDLYLGTEKYASDIKTDADGHLISASGKYGTEGKYLIAGTYTLKETSANGDYSRWADGIRFTVGLGENATGEHGTAWISTAKAENGGISPTVDYVRSTGTHSYADAADTTCKPAQPESAVNALNMESRGVITFTKTGATAETALDTHGNATGESVAYFGVYTDASCTTQVAGMLAADEVHFALTDRAADTATALTAVNNAAGLPYLRAYGSGFALLSGTYYVKELVAPAGYRLDETVRTAVIARLDTTAFDADLSGVYSNNVASIDGAADYKWTNTPNVLTLYKRDQFGRRVTLNQNGYLELSVPAGKTFPNGETTIKLYQNATTPSSLTGYVTYDAESGSWTVTGLLDISTTYTLSEPDAAVPANNLQAKTVTFKVGTDGALESVTEAVAKDDPLAHTGDDFGSYYRSAAEGSTIVLRDVAKYLTDVAVIKQDTKTSAVLKDISFELYKYDGKDASGKPLNSVSVLEEGVVLTTDETGTIETVKETEKKNLVTNSMLSYGLDVGSYYLHEVEKGAADGYALRDIYFTITPITPEKDGDPCAKVTFATDDHVTQSGNTATVNNDPLPGTNHIKLTKSDTGTALSGARFTLSYVSDTHGEPGSATGNGTDTIVTSCVTGTDGKLYVANDDWSAKTDLPDISMKGDYTLTEIKAPDASDPQKSYMTPTETPVVITFTVNISGRVTSVSAGASTLVTEAKATENGIDLSVALANEKTELSVAKRSDIVSNTKTAGSLEGELLTGATLEIKQGDTVVATLKDASEWSVEAGLLQENVIYTLHESVTPNGYLTAKDIYFYLFGTVTAGGKTVSKLYVWTGTGAPTSVEASDSWSETASNNAMVLTMVDEAIIAPVDVQKVVGKSSYELLPGAVFEVRSGDTLLGTAETGTDGFLTWKTVESAGYATGLLYTDAGARAASGLVGKRLVLRQNESGYTLKETWAPDHAYVVDHTYTVRITADNYQAYRSVGTEGYSYASDLYIDLVAADKATGKTVSSLTSRTETAAAAATDLVDPPFEAAFELYKYDAEDPDLIATHDNYEKIGLAGVVFTLSKKQADGTYTAVGDYTTGAKGLLHIDLTEKGTYRLVEKTPLTGYVLNETVLEFTVINSDYKKTLTYDGSADNGTADLNASGVTHADLPNARQHGTVIVRKRDKDSLALLNEVAYTLVRTGDSEGNAAVNALVDKGFPNAPTSLTLKTGYEYTIVETADAQPTVVTLGEADKGKLVIHNLQWGTYTLTESQENDGYILDTTAWAFTIDAEHLRDETTYYGDHCVTNTKNQVTLNKTDLGTTVLKGAEFTLYRVVDSRRGALASFYASADATTRTTNGKLTVTNGELTIYGLAAGTYLLEETLAPKGYEPASPILFTMNRDGTVSDVKLCTLDGTDIKAVRENTAVAVGSTAGTGTSVTNSLTVKDEPIRVSLTKQLVDDNGNPIDIGNRGTAQFKLETIGGYSFADGTTTKTFTANSITTELDHMLVGDRDYRLTELAAPAGYEVQSKSIRLHVDKNGRVTLPDNPSFVNVENKEDGIAYITYTDKPIVIVLAKLQTMQNDDGSYDVNEDDLGHAEFSITGRFVTDGSVDTEDRTITGLTTDADGTRFSELLAGRLIYGNPYTVTETKAPNGLKVAKSFTIKIKNDGTIEQIAGDGKAAASAKVEENGDVKLFVKDGPNTITIKKVDDNGALAGASFTLNAKDTTVETAFVNIDPEKKPDEATTWSVTELAWTSTKQGIVLTNHLIADLHYILHEERVVNHEVMTSDIELHIEQDGTVVIDTNSIFPNNAETLKAATLSGTTLTVMNPIIRGSVQLTKYYRDSSTATAAYDDAHVLAGAVYTLTRIENEKGETVTESIKATGTAGSYAHDQAKTGNGTDRFVTGSDGKITITGLPEGKYELIEVDAPKAYHINNDAENDTIVFELHDSTKAHYTVPSEKTLDTRINAQISLTKYTGEALLPGAVFEVAYSETKTGTYTAVGTMTANENGVATMTQATYPSESAAEGLRRGFYRLTELSANGQLMNTTDYTRNTVEFEIGNEIDKTYTVQADGEAYTAGGTYISLTENGVADTPIPPKSVTVTKLWSGDTGLEKTFRPSEITVKLTRTYTDAAGTTTEVAITEDMSGSAVEAQVTVTPTEVEGQTVWTHTWSNLPAYVNVTENDRAVSYLYTYAVEEVNTKSWYADENTAAPSPAYAYETDTGNTAETGIEDGNTAATITNSLDGGDAPKKLMITKLLGGGSATDSFYVRVKLWDGEGNAIGNTILTDAQGNSFGIYLDTGTVTQSSVQRTPDTEGWMLIHGGETILVKLPQGVKYEVEEKPYEVGADGYDYTPRYDKNRSGTITADTETAVRNAVHKSIAVTKTNGSEDLEGAEYTVMYVPGTNNTNPEAVGTAWTKTQCKVDSNGTLADSEGNALDITPQGRYDIYETKAPIGYMTPTDNKGDPIPLVQITISAYDQMTVMVAGGNAEALVTRNGNDNDGRSKDSSVADITVKNEKTRARIGKTIDYAAPHNGADAQEGTALSGAKLQLKKGSDVLAEWSTDGTLYITEGAKLEEGTVYTLHEVEAPTGYLEAADIYFRPEGTYTVGTERYSRVVLTDSGGAALTDTDQNTAGTAYGKPGMIQGVLQLADETIIAPVDLRKVLRSYDETTCTAVKDVVFTVKAGDTVLGTAVTTDKGYLVWQEIKDYTTNLIYSDTGKLVTSEGVGTHIVLRQNDAGYTLTETYAPDGVYNDSRVYTVCITDQNYKDYRKGDGSYYTDRYIDAVAASKAADHTAGTLSTRNTVTEYTSGFDALAVNETYRSTVTLHKYDGDEEADSAPIAGTVFTLYRGDAVYTKAYAVTAEGASEVCTLSTDGTFTTDTNGDLKLRIREKGSYTLKETAAATGYVLPETAPSFSFTLVDDDEKATGYGYDDTNALGNVSNTRLTGTVTLTKKDAGTEQALDGVVYTLTRTDAHATGSYLLAQPAEVITGKSYVAEKGEGGWTLTESDGTAGTITVSGLNWGSYTLTEKTELSGYRLEKDSEGKVTNAFSFTVDGTTNALSFTDADTNPKNAIVLKKTDMADTAAGVAEADVKGLAGAVFEVHEGAACGDGCSHTAVAFYASAAATTTVTSVTTGEDGTVTIYGLPTDNTNENQGIRTYHLVETVAPKGYKLQTEPVVFTVDRQGSIMVMESAGYVERDCVTMKDELIKVTLRKLGEGDNTLSGAVFTLKDTCTGTCDHRLADGSTEKTLTLTNGTLMIPTASVTLIGGHTYTVTETLAPAGYECNAVVTFTVGTDGTATVTSTAGGYRGTEGTQECAASDGSADPVISIHDEKVRLTITKVDAEDGKALQGVQFTLKPREGSAFAELTDPLPDNVTYKDGVYIMTTDKDGLAYVPDGLLIAGNSYLLQETATISGYYLSREAADGVILNVAQNGAVSIERLSAYTDKTIGTEDSCPISVKHEGTETNPKNVLTAKNRRAVTFSVTKKVDGNMGDLTGTFHIKLELYEPDGTEIGTREIDVRYGQTYDSAKGLESIETSGTYDETKAFGVDTIPVGARVRIIEANEMDYSAIVTVGGQVIAQAEGTPKGTADVTLYRDLADTENRVAIELTNRKNVTLDVGVRLDDQTAWAALALILPAAWLLLRSRRRRRGGGEIV